MNAASTRPVNEGDILDGKYRVDQVLGVGGMGVVVAATHLQLEQRVAIKYLLPSALEHPEIVERFGREARAAAKVHGQHVVRVIDVGRLPDGRNYMVMEHLSGEDLDEVLRKRIRIPIAEAVGYVLQACEAVAQAHVAGIVHRDLKPANLFLAQTPDHRTVIKVLDFGISKVAGDKAITRTATAMGTAHYMCPEQLMSAKDVDERADIWALGVILFELISGEKPFEGEALPAIVAKILSNQRPRIHELVPEAPAQLEAIIARSLTTSRSDRYSSVAAFAEAIGPYATTEQRASVERIARIQAAPPSTGPSGGTERNEAWIVDANNATIPAGGADLAEAVSARELDGPTSTQAADNVEPVRAVSPLAGTESVINTTAAVAPVAWSARRALRGILAAGIVGGAALGVSIMSARLRKAPSATAIATSTTNAPTAAVATSISSAEPTATQAFTAASASAPLAGQAAPTASASAKALPTVVSAPGATPVDNRITKPSTTPSHPPMGATASTQSPTSVAPTSTTTFVQPLL